MKKNSTVIIVAIILVAACIVALVVYNINGRQVNTVQQSGQSDDQYAAVDACDILTEDAAKEFLGSAATADTTIEPVKTVDLEINNCSYSAGADGAELLVRAAKTAIGAKSNQDQFRFAKQAEAEVVEGIGDQAFYNAEVGQLNVLKGGNWYVVTSHKERVGNTSLEMNKQLAAKLRFQ